MRRGGASARGAKNQGHVGLAGEGVAAAAASPAAAGCGRSEQRYGFHAPSTSQ